MTDPGQPVTPHLVVSDAASALDFYKNALGAVETMRLPAEDGKRIMHAEFEAYGARIFVRDHFPEFTDGCGQNSVQPPDATGATSVTMHLEVSDCDAAIERAVSAGARITMPPEDTFWGARYGQVVDPFGHAWSFAHPLPGHPGLEAGDRK